MRFTKRSWRRHLPHRKHASRWQNETGRGSESLWWAAKPGLRRLVILTALERRAGFRKPNQPGTVAERFQRATERLKAKNTEAIELLRIQMHLDDHNFAKLSRRRTALKIELQFPEVVEGIIAGLTEKPPLTIRQVALKHKLRKSTVSKWLYRLEEIARELEEKPGARG